MGDGGRRVSLETISAPISVRSNLPPLSVPVSPSPVSRLAVSPSPVSREATRDFVALDM